MCRLTIHLVIGAIKCFLIQWKVINLHARRQYTVYVQRRECDRHPYAVSEVLIESLLLCPGYNPHNATLEMEVSPEGGFRLKFIMSPVLDLFFEFPICLCLSHFLSLFALFGHSVISPGCFQMERRGSGIRQACNEQLKEPSSIS